MSVSLQKKKKQNPKMLLHFRKWPAQPFLGLDRLLGSSQGSPGDRPPCSHREENLPCAVSIPMAGHAARSQPHHLVPLPWHWWGEELARFGVCLLLGLGVDTCDKHCDFDRSVCFFAALLVGESLQYEVRVSVGLQSAPAKMPLLLREAGACCLRACFCREELLCINPNFFPAWKAFFLLPGRELNHAAEQS